ncbi:MAG: hypothetical protein P8123_05025 [bacterium]
MEGYVVCPNCQGETPGENLNCIYCGSVLPHRLGVFTKLRYGGRGYLFVSIVLAVLIALFAWLVL